MTYQAIEDRLADILKEGDEHLRSYIVNRETYLGQIDTNVYPGDTILYTRGLMRYFGKRYDMNTLESAMVRKWVTLEEGQQPDPQVENVVKRKQAAMNLPQTGSLPVNLHMTSMGQSQNYGDVAQNARLGYTNNSAKGAQTMGGVEILPENWDSLSWTHKRTYILKMTDAELLEDMLEDEIPKLQKIMMRQIEKIRSGQLNSPATASFQDVNVPLNPTTPPHVAKPSMTAVMEEMASETIIPTNFGEAAPKKGRVPRSTPMQMNGGIVEGNDSDIHIAFDG